MKEKLKKIIPNREFIEKQKILRPFSRWIANPKLWYINRKAVAMGFAIGIFFGSIPIAGQMFLSAIFSVLLKSNMPVAILATWISNPFTMPFLYTANYYFGSWLLGHYDHINIYDISWSIDGIIELGDDILFPLFLGSVVIGIILATFSFIIIRFSWRLHIISRIRSKRIR